MSAEQDRRNREEIASDPMGALRPDRRGQGGGSTEKTDQNRQSGQSGTNQRGKCT